MFDSQLNKMVGSLSGNKSRAWPPQGQLTKYSSSSCLLGDFNDAEEEGWNTGQMSDQESEDFEKMLENMNLTEEKKEPLRRLPNNMRDILTMNSKSVSVSPVDYIQFLSNPELSLSKTFRCIESLRVALTNNGLDWVQDFGEKGVEQLLNILNKKSFRASE